MAENNEDGLRGIQSLCNILTFEKYYKLQLSTGAFVILKAEI